MHATPSAFSLFSQWGQSLKYKSKVPLGYQNKSLALVCKEGGKLILNTLLMFLLPPAVTQ